MSVTRGEKEWDSHPFLARALRVLLVVAPFVCGWFAIRATQQFFFGNELTGIVGALAFLTQAVVVSVVVAGAVSRLLHRWTPLVALFEMSLVFPDHAPSRFKLALRSSSVKKLIGANGGVQLDPDVQTAAEQAVQMVTELARHDRLTRGHTERVRAYADVIGQELGLSDKDLNGLRWGALLHDVGKMAVPPEILNKPGKPTEQEWAILRNHPTAAISLLEPLRGWLGDWLLAASEHHERWDGAGYPVGLSGRDISLAGRIVAVADAYDVITSRRSYKAPATAEEARKELVRSSNSHFDPAVVRALLESGLRRDSAAIRFGWVLETPGLARFLQLGGQTVTSLTGSVAVAATVVAAAATAVVGGAEQASTPPPQIAFADDGAQVQLEEPGFGADSATPTTNLAHTAPEQVTVDDQLPSTTTTVLAALDPPSESTAPETSNTETTIVPAESVTSTSAVSAVPTTSSTVLQEDDTTQVAPTTTLAATVQPRTSTTPTTRPDLGTTTAPPTTTRPATTTLAPTSTVAQCKTTADGTAIVGVLVGCDLSGQTLTGLDLGGANLRGVDLSNAVISETNLNNADLRDANLTGATFMNGSAIDVSFVAADLTGATFKSFDLSRSDLSDTSLRNVAFDMVSFSFAGVRNADFRGATFTDTNFLDADLRGSDLSGNQLDTIEFIRTKIDGMIISNTTNTDTVYQSATGTPVGHGTASFLRTTCPDGSFGDQSCW